MPNPNTDPISPVSTTKQSDVTQWELNELLEQIHCNLSMSVFEKELLISLMMEKLGSLDENLMSINKKREALQGMIRRLCDKEG